MFTSSGSFAIELLDVVAVERYFGITAVTTILNGQTKVYRLLCDIQSHRQILDKFEKKLLQQTVEQSLPKDVVFDLSKCKVFSIERTPQQTTVVGYIDKDGRVCEWTLPITLAQHNDLCAEQKRLCT